MNMHYEVAKAEIATRRYHAEHRRAAKSVRTQRRPGLTPRWQRFLHLTLRERPGPMDSATCGPRSESGPTRRVSTSGGGWPYGRGQSKRGMWWQMRSLLSRFSDWVVVDPVWWGVGSEPCWCYSALLSIWHRSWSLRPQPPSPANILHARRRGYCPLPAEPGSPPVRAEAE